MESKEAPILHAVLGLSPSDGRQLDLALLRLLEHVPSVHDGVVSMLSTVCHSAAPVFKSALVLLLLPENDGLRALMERTEVELPRVQAFWKALPAHRSEWTASALAGKSSVAEFVAGCAGLYQCRCAPHHSPSFREETKLTHT